MKSRFVIIFLFLIYQSTHAQIRLPRLIRDSMVLQRDTRLKMWGWASAGEKITIRFNNKTYKTTTAKDGKWQVMMAPVKAGGPYTMHLEGKNNLRLNNILIGDVWFCSGQSNMVHQMILHRDRYEKEIAAANYPEIRHFAIATATDLQEPRDDFASGSWKSANPQNVLQFSAVAYFFAKTIYDKYHVPIGLINASVGGTPIEAWTSEEGLKTFSPIASIIEKNKDTAYVNNLDRRAAASRPNTIPRNQDKGLSGPLRWFDTSYAPKNWRNIHIPGYWEDQGIKELDGVVWYRREISVPASMTGKPARVALGRIVDADQLYINGKLVGSTSYMYPQRRYAVPDDLLKAGKNIFVIRVTNQSGKGGFVPDKPYYLSSGEDQLDLKGDWQYKVGEVYVLQTVTGGAGIVAQNQPTALYNAMVAPVTNYSIKGILWYQGESNVDNAAQYAQLMPALINDWRTKWQDPDLPFLYVQLPNFQEVQYQPAESAWAVLREAQLKTLSVPNTGMAVAIDLGEWNDIHPDNKKDVGVRLALNALKIAYGEKQLVHSGPIYESSKVEGNKIILSFSNTGSGLIAIDEEPLNWFAIAGEDKKFVWANAVIEGDKVIVSSEAIINPRFVRYAWADNPDGANLYNKEGLPASPFGTDQ